MPGVAVADSASERLLPMLEQLQQQGADASSIEDAIDKKVVFFSRDDEGKKRASEAEEKKSEASKAENTNSLVFLAAFQRSEFFRFRTTAPSPRLSTPPIRVPAHRMSRDNPFAGGGFDKVCPS